MYLRDDEAMKKKYLVTGGAGFVGCNLVNRLVAQGEDVIAFDNLSRRGVTENLKWLRESHGEKSFRFYEGDIRNFEQISDAMRGVDVVFHFAGQVAVTTSVTNPREDFDINALGTFNVLEAARAQSTPPTVIFTSTNKVYGGLDNVRIHETETRYELSDLPLGIKEDHPLDFYSPYGCSKGTADQYVRDYGRIYGIPTVVLRMSCIYGYRQFGIEDQGWIAWFLIASVLGKQITIYGDGKQTRDILFIEDLVDLFQLVANNPDKVKGQIFNVGGGRANSISVWHELWPQMEKSLGFKPNVSRGDWRPGDQRIYISDTTKAEKLLGWKPKVSVAEGVEHIVSWIKENKHMFTL